MAYMQYLLEVQNNVKFICGKLINKITAEVGGSGGGHAKACGASVPKVKISKFINAINSALDK